MPQKGSSDATRNSFVVALARAVPVLGLLRDIFKGGGLARGTVGGMVSLATRQTPQIDDNSNPRTRGIAMNKGVWRVAKLTISPTVRPPGQAAPP